MNMGIKRKSHFKGSHEAVSEVIGTLLILAITVILFSTVLFYVAQIPAPDQNTSVDFGTEPLVIVGNSTLVKVTMEGGQTLYDGSTTIVIFVNETSSLHKISDDPKVGNDWMTGETWTYNLTGVDMSTSVRVMILDSTSNSIVWESKLPLPIKSIPVIGERGMTPSMPIIDNSSYLWAYVYDYDGVILSVTADMSGLGQAQGNTIIFMDRGSNLWESPQLTVNSNWTNAEIMLTAMDNDLHSVTGRMSLDATTGAGSGSSDDSGYEPQNIIYSKSNGFNLFKKNDWDANAFNATPTYTFVLNGDGAAVVVVSKSLLNTESKNFISVIEADTKEVVYEKSTNAFTRYRYTSGYYSYKSYLDISSPVFQDNTRYIVQIRLEDNSNPTNKIFINHDLTTGTGGSTPTIKTFNDTAYSKPDSTYYNNEVFYVEIKGTNLPAAGTFYPAGGELILRDFVGGTQVKMGLPSTSTSWNGPVSGMTRVDQNTYRFSINLTAAKLGDSWIPGKNQAYIMAFDMFTLQNGTNFQPYYLSSVVYITSPVFSGGIAAGIVQGVTPAIPSYGATMGISAWVQSSSMLYYVNDNTWTPPEYMEPFNQWSDYRPQCLLTTSGDMNGDGKNSEVVSYLTLTIPAADDSPSNAPIYQSYWVPKIVIYDRSTTGGWSSTVIKTMYQGGVADGSQNFVQVKSLAVGNIDKDDDKDVIFGMANGSLGMCRNDGFWSYKQIWKNPTGSSIISLALADLDPAGVHDRNRSLDIVVGCRDGTVWIIKNTDGMGTFPAGGVKSVSTPGLTFISSLCLGDMDNDKLTDLVVVGGSGANGYVCVGYNANLQAAPSVSSIVGAIAAFSSTNAPKTNVSIGNYASVDNYPDIAVAVGGMSVASGYGGIWLIKHTFAGTHSYLSPIRTITTIATDTEGPNCYAKIQCMVSVDVDNDGLLDFIVGTGDWRASTTRNEWRGNVLIFLNKDGTGAFARYIVDNTGVPVRSVAVTRGG
jgi:FlaG/FlaF family flagellin (archaellin)